MYAKKSANEILQLGTAKRQTSQLRRALVESGRKYCCEICGIKEWQGKELVIEIHHKDGNNLNNVESNLQFLCPNCHSLTPNFYNTKFQYFCTCGKPRLKSSKVCNTCNITSPKINRRKVVRPDKTTLECLLKDKSMVQIAKTYGVSDNAVRKWCKSYQIPL